MFFSDKLPYKLDKGAMKLTDTARFFIVYPPNLEDLGLLELNHKFAQYFPNDSLEINSKIPGGIELECTLINGLLLNKILRAPTRILLRLGEFKCRDAPKLFQKMSKFNWAPWLIGQTPEIESATSNSRLFDSRKIEKAIQDGVLQYYRHKPVKKKYLEHFEKIKSSKDMTLPKIYFRAVDDICTISIDTTGERLHLRGEKTLTGLAPIRESLAALLLIEIEKHLSDKSYTLIDPMCGSGTILLEASDKDALTLDRDFSFNHLPVMIDQTLPIKMNSIASSNKFKSFLGFEINNEVVKMAQKNVEGKNIEIMKADLFDGKNQKIDDAVVVLNPPYGIRVGEKSDINLAYYLKVLENIKLKFNPDLVGIIIPAEYFLVNNPDFKIRSARPFKNGGIEVTFYVLEFK